MPDPENQDVYFESLEYSFDYGSYFENLMLIPKGHELQYEDNLKFVRIIDLSMAALVSEGHHNLAKRCKHHLLECFLDYL
nr:hypothetical protein CFP56_58864 [Quercus suber]